jgi:hypothetical protein
MRGARERARACFRGILAAMNRSLIGLLFMGCVACGSDPPAASSSSSGADAQAPDALAPLADGSAGTDGGADSADSADSATGDPGRYDRDGAETYSTSTASVTNTPRTFTVTVYTPSSAGPHAVVTINPGLAQPAAGYAPYAKRLASHGFVVLLRDDPGPLTSTTDVESDLVYTVDVWLRAQAGADAGGALSGKVDMTRVGLAGHSRGGKTSLLAAERGLKGKVKAWFGLDPVDSNAASGGAQARDFLATIGIPTGYLGASVTSTCSPAADNYAVLYAANPSPSVLITGVGAGHTQLQDPGACVACGLCTPAGTADTAVVLAYAVRYLTAFFARELLGDASVGVAFQGAGAPNDVAAGRVTVASK